MQGFINGAIVMGPILFFGGLLLRLGPSPRENPRDQTSNVLWWLGLPTLVLGGVLTVAALTAMALS